MAADRQLRSRLRLGDVDDLEALVGSLIRKSFPWLAPDDHEELKRDSFELAIAIFNRLPPGHSFAKALADELPDDLKDRQRTTPEGKDRRAEGRNPVTESLADESTAPYP